MKFLKLIFITLFIFVSVAPSNSEQESDILVILPAILAGAALNTDNDGDGFSENQGDCNDKDIKTYLGAFESCDDGIDQDCNGIDPLCPEYDGDPTIVEGTWLYGRHSLPAEIMSNGIAISYKQSLGEPEWTTLAESEIIPNTKVPAVLYLHGCAGISYEAWVYTQLLVEEGYAVFIPDSFEREGGRLPCSQWGSLQYRVSQRTEEAKYALTRILELDWVDQEKIVLMGFSEGGNTVDNWSQSGFAAHIIIGSACTLVGGSPAAPPDVPVLAIVGSNDEFRPGLSCNVYRTICGSSSIVIQGAGHAIAEYPETQEAILTFLNQSCL